MNKRHPKAYLKINSHSFAKYLALALLKYIRKLKGKIRILKIIEENKNIFLSKSVLFHI